MSYVHDSILRKLDSATQKIFDLEAKVAELEAELNQCLSVHAKLEHALSEIREVYAGSEGINFEPLTAPEGYLQRLIKQCYQIAVDALKQEE